MGTSHSDAIAPEENLTAYPVNEQRQLRIRGGVRNWSAKSMEILRPESFEHLEDYEIPGPKVAPQESIFSQEIPEIWTYIQHGIAKATAMILGLRHHHDGDDLVITAGWPAVLEGFGFSDDGKKPLRIVDAKSRFEQRIEQLKDCHVTSVSYTHLTLPTKA